MTTKSEKLKLDIDRLQCALDLIEKKLSDIDCGNTKNSDPTTVAKLIKDKDDIERFLQDKKAELKIEEDNYKVKSFGSVHMNATQLARLSVGGSLKTSSLDKVSVKDEEKIKIINTTYSKEPDEKKRADKLLEEGFIVQRKM